MELWSGAKSSGDTNCRTEVPSLYWWLVCNVALFYFIVSFGLAVWGSYICKVVDTQEDITKEAVKEYLDWILSEVGQCIISKKGYAPVKPSENCG